MAERIDLNQADADELASLPGIGEVIAQRIVEYRETVQPFSEVSELSAVEGISDKTLEAVGDRLTVSDMVEDSSEEVSETVPEEEGALEEEGVPEEEGAPAEEGVPETEPESPPAEADKQHGRVPSAAEAGPPSEDGEEPLDEDEIVIMAGEAVEEDAPEEMAEAISTEAGPAPETGETVAAPQPAPTRTGSSFWGHLLAASVGAACGVVLTLAVLMLLNGTLRLNDTASIDELETQMDQAVSTAQAEQSGLNENIDALDERITILVTVDRETASSLADTQADLVVIEDDLAGVTGEVGALQEKAVELDERLIAVAVSAENFDAFLNGLRDLMATLPGPAAGSVLTPTETSTTTVPSPAVTAPRTEGSPTPVVTRTPRPTATPFALPVR
jgi:competence ComEA-like helix-hairpin-helix protein